MPKKPSKKSKTNAIKTEQFQLYLLPGLIFAFVFLFGLLVLRPKIEEIFDINSKIDREELRLSRLTNKVEQLESVDQAELKDKIMVATQAVPLDKNVPMLLIMLKSMAQDHDVQVKTISIDPGELATESAALKRDSLLLDFNMTIKGGMEAVKAYLSLISRVVPIMKVDKISTGGEVFQADITMTFPLSSPFEPEPEMIFTPEKPLVQISEEEQRLYEKLAELDDVYFLKEIEPVETGKVNPFIY